MNWILDKLFREDETLSPRAAVAAGLVAYTLLIFKPVMGIGTLIFAIPILIICLALVCYTILRLLMPKMDPRDPDADRFVVWGGTALFVLMGFEGFGWWYPPGLILGGGLLYWRAPELLEVFPYFEEKGNVDFDRLHHPGKRPRNDPGNPNDPIGRG